MHDQCTAAHTCARASPPTDSKKYDINRITFECAWLTDESGGVEQHTIVKQRLIRLTELPTSDAPVVDAVVESMNKAKSAISKVVSVSSGGMCAYCVQLKWNARARVGRCVDNSRGKCVRV